MNVPFIKCHGSGNDFVLIDESASEIFKEEERSIVSKLFCDRSGPVGADGVLYYLVSSSKDIKMRMFNPDGSEPQTCANGLRCIARYAFEKMDLKSVSIEIMKGFSVAKVTSDILPGVHTVNVEVGPISLNPLDLPLIVNEARFVSKYIPEISESFPLTALSAPNPHLVAIVDDIDEKELIRIGKKSESAPPILPERANISFVKKLSKDSMFISTFERGGGITGSCGSAMASSSVAMCLLEEFKFGELLKVYNRNGFVYCQPTKNTNNDIYVSMTGNATFVYSAKVELDLTLRKLSSMVTGKLNLNEIESYVQVNDEAKKIIDTYRIELEPENSGLISCGC